uniref:hypothetical protein n=1 Tax=Endozoicomonas sp. SESOKO2 TaxID=2828743 RepID=UPI002147F9CA
RKVSLTINPFDKSLRLFFSHQIPGQKVTLDFHTRGLRHFETVQANPCIFYWEDVAGSPPFPVND